MIEHWKHAMTESDKQKTLRGKEYNFWCKYYEVQINIWNKLYL